MATREEEEDDDKMAVYRDELARLANNKKTRLLGWPRDWRPHSVENPDSRLTFTEAGAWALIAELLKNGEPVEMVKLDNPPGQKAFVMKHEIEQGKPLLYIKIHFGNAKIIGRSFHYSE